MKNVTASLDIVAARLQPNAARKSRVAIAFFAVSPHFASVGEHPRPHRLIAHALPPRAAAEPDIPGFTGALSYPHHLGHRSASSQLGSLHSWVVP